MRAAIFNGPRSIEVGERPDARVEHPTDAVVRVVMACVCGSDLWYYRGESQHAVGSIGHEFIGVVEDVGGEVTTVAVGVDAALECVGTQQAIDTAAVIARPGSTIGIVGVPHGTVPFEATFFRNIAWRGGPAPARIYIPELLEDVLDGRIDPGQVLDLETDLDGTPKAYAAMDDRTAIKSLIRVGTV